MASTDEIAFIKAHVTSISPLPIAFPNDYHPPLEEFPKRVPTFPVDVLPPPASARKPEASSSSSAESITLVLKSIKPPLQFSVKAHPTDTVAHLKALLASQPRAPPADAQRLLIKGKVLADTKLLKEYDNIAHEGTVISIMIKPGHEWDGKEKETAATSAKPTPIQTNPSTLTPEQKPHGHARRNSDIPAVTLSTPVGTPGATTPITGPSPALTVPIPLGLDALPPPAHVPEQSTYHTTVSDPVFWDKLHDWLRGEFKNKDDADAAWEEFLLASKARLTPHEVAKIRDAVGLSGMAGH